MKVVLYPLLFLVSRAAFSFSFIKNYDNFLQSKDPELDYEFMRFINHYGKKY